MLTPPLTNQNEVYQGCSTQLVVVDVVVICRSCSINHVNTPDGYLMV